MKLFLFIPVILLLLVTPAFGQLLSDKTGLVNRFDVETGGYTFEVKTISNFDVKSHEFDKDEKRLTIFVNSGLENNLGEVTIPKSLLSGNFTFYLNDMQLYPKIKSNDKISFVTLNFTGTGTNKIDIVATETFTGLIEKLETITTDESQSKKGGACLIATATYGSELTQQVQQLREFRDNKLLNTELGKEFMNTFNDAYYSFSPVIADYERENPVFKEIVKITITPMITSLSVLNHVEMDSDVEVLGYGISLILLNVGMYIGIPASIIIGMRKKF